MNDVFVFDSYGYSPDTHEAYFTYKIRDYVYTERLAFAPPAGDVNQVVFDAALRLAFLLVGTSYYKCFPAAKAELPFVVDEWQANFLNSVYRDGISQFIFENKLDPNTLVYFDATGESKSAGELGAEGIVCLQSGGKDSLLLASMLREKGTASTPWYVSSTDVHPSVLDTFETPLRVVKRIIARDELARAKENGGLNGHVPVTYIVTSFAIIDAVLHGENTVLLGIGNEGAEAHAYVGDMAVNHQWSKTWPAEQMFSEYVRRYIATDMRVGSPLRSFTELHIAELFVQHAWGRYGRSFSSCNVGNYRQGNDNTTLGWCGTCSKCANSYLLFAPFVDPAELRDVFGSDLLANPDLVDDFKGLLGIDDAMKPFECVGEVDELRAAYRMALTRGYTALPLDVPESLFDKDANHPAQPWVNEL